LSLSIPHRTPGQEGVGPTVRMGRRSHVTFIVFLARNRAGSIIQTSIGPCTHASIIHLRDSPLSAKPQPTGNASHRSTFTHNHLVPIDPRNGGGRVEKRTWISMHGVDARPDAAQVHDRVARRCTTRRGTGADPQPEADARQRVSPHIYVDTYAHGGGARAQVHDHGRRASPRKCMTRHRSTATHRSTIRSNLPTPTAALVPKSTIRPYLLTATAALALMPVVDKPRFVCYSQACMLV
jgi:hypothetical protein